MRELPPSSSLHENDFKLFTNFPCQNEQFRKKSKEKHKTNKVCQFIYCTDVSFLYSETRCSVFQTEGQKKVLPKSALWENRVVLGIGNHPKHRKRFKNEIMNIIPIKKELLLTVAVSTTFEKWYMSGALLRMNLNPNLLLLSWKEKKHKTGLV